MCGTILGGPAELASYRIRVNGGRFIDSGSGTAINSHQILTCAHILRDYPNGKITVDYPYENLSYSAKLIDMDLELDLALLEVNGIMKNYVRLSNKTINVGEPIRVLGYPNGNSRLSRTMTTLSPNRYMKNIYTASGHTVGGQSGGGIFNKDYELISVIWGNVDNTIHAVPLTTIRQWVTGKLCPGCPNCLKGRSPQNQSPGNLVPIPPTPAPSPELPESPQDPEPPKVDYDHERLEQALEALKVQGDVVVNNTEEIKIGVSTIDDKTDTILNALVIIAENLQTNKSKADPNRVIKELKDHISSLWVNEPDINVRELPLMIYLTARGHPGVMETDKMIEDKIEKGLNIRVVRLNPTEVLVRDLPRLVVFPRGNVIRGSSNVMVYLSGLIK